ncbi:MAG: peptide-methionine (S)-S-oxide reductase MsrA [Fimbriimonadales bacterium]|nr:peptide-methionine (S)-S-oxide reductase MsrA [Fimbriimonadales bacterium]
MNWLPILAVSLLSAGCHFGVGAAQQGGGRDTKHVGTRPGDVGKVQDIAKVARDRGHELAVFAQGCFWCYEPHYRATEGVVATAVGYIGGKVENPTYAQVCTGTTGHAEAVLIEFDPKVVTYEALLKIFWTTHDPTTLNRQGPDIGTQYRSAIFTFSAEQERKAKQSVPQAQKQWKDPIVTEIVPATTFWLAEEYHQQYYEKKGIKN